MTQKAEAPKSGKMPDPEKQEEARHLAEEAVEELQHGNKEEAKFVLNEARHLDPKAVDEVLKDKKI